MRTTFFKHALVSTAASAAVLLAAGGIASAHVDPDPLAMEAGTTGDVAFMIEHGCDGSPTTSLKFEIPDGVTSVAPIAKDGWTATVTGNVLEFKGGPLPADQEDQFAITMTAPAAAAEARFPVIQTCEQGELAWIEIPAEGAAEPEHPAPTLTITAGPPTAEDLASEEEASADAGTASTEAAATGDTVGVVATAAVAPASSDDSSNTGTIVVVVIAAAIVVAGGIFLARRKKASAQDEPKS
jgi:uncharacterized protein YcnI